MSNTAIIAVRAHGTAVANSHLPLTPVRADDQEVSDFTAELEGALKELEKAFTEKESVDEKLQVLQQDLAGRGFWGQLKNNVSGKTDKELSVMVEGLATSLGLTQSAVRVMLKVQTKKSRMLRQFSDALVGKILKIQGDTQTLDRSQRQAALFFLGELQDQINEQIRQQELVDSHELRLGDHEQWQRNKDESDGALRSQVVHFQAEQAGLTHRIASLEPRLDDHARRFDRHHARLDDHERWQRDKVESDAALAGQFSYLQGEHAGLKQQFATVDSRLAELGQGLERHRVRFDEHDQWRHDKDEREARLVGKVSQLENETTSMKDQIASLTARLAVFEENETRSRLPKTIFIRNLLPALALVLAGLALFLLVAR